MQGRNYLCEEHTGVIGECLHQRLQELGGEQSRERVPVCCMELGAGGQAQTGIRLTAGTVPRIHPFSWGMI